MRMLKKSKIKERYSFSFLFHVQSRAGGRFDGNSGKIICFKLLIKKRVKEKTVKRKIIIDYKA
jgi:hypothetical protein